MTLRLPQLLRNLSDEKQMSMVTAALLTVCQSFFLQMRYTYNNFARISESTFESLFSWCQLLLTKILEMKRLLLPIVTGDTVRSYYRYHSCCWMDLR